MQNLGGGADLKLNNTVFIGSTSGTLTSSTEGSFNPQESSVSTTDDTLSYRFASAIDTVSADTLSSVTVVTRNNVVIQISATAGGGSGKLYTCFAEAQPILGTPACGGVTIAANRRTLTFNGNSLSTGKNGGSLPLTLTGTLTNQGL